VRILTRVFALALLVAVPRTAATAQARTDFPEGVGTLTRWFDHIQRNELDSLAGLLAPDFIFVSDGARLDAKAFVTMIKGLGISHPRVQLSNVVAHQSGDIGYLVYDRLESFESHGVTKAVPEAGSMVLKRHGAGWLIALWTATSPPS
jgi:ketosteroid isomerase-like protein